MALQKHLTLIFLSFFSFQALFCAEREKSPVAAFWWSFLVPGGGYFYRGQTAKGAAYFTATAGLAGWGLDRNKTTVGDEINAPLIYAQQLHVLQIYLSNRDFREVHETDGLGQLALAPFRRKNFSSPWVIGFALLGGGLNYAIARSEGAQRDFSDISTVRILGNTFNRDRGFAVYSAYWVPLSLGAGMSEEALFRGMIQSDWQERWGRGNGLLAASALFGLAHYDGKGASVGNALFATLAGLYLGWRFNANGDRLSESIAAHFWFDAVAGATLYLADPANNPLGAKVEFSF